MLSSTQLVSLGYFLLHLASQAARSRRTSERSRRSYIQRNSSRQSSSTLRCSLAITHTRRADRDRADTGHYRQMAVAHNTLAAILSLEAHMLAEKISDLGLYGLRQRPAARFR